MLSDKRAFSSVVSALILMLLAVATGVVVYSYIMGWIGGATHSSPGITMGQLQFESLYATAGSPGTITVYIRNIGQKELTISRVYVNGENKTFTLSDYTLSISEVSGTISVSHTMTAGLIYEVKVTCTDGTIVSQSVEAKAADTVGGDWWNINWAYRKLITVDHNYVSSNLTDFPMLVKGNYSDLTNHAQSDYDDVCFVAWDNVTKLDHEIEDYDNSSGYVVAWVRVNLAASSDTKFWMYYGNSDCNSQQNPTGVWDSNFKAVWHLSESTGGINAIEDSTSNSNNGTDNGTPTFGETGKIGDSIHFDGANDCIIVPDDASLHLGSGLTIEAWINIDTWGNWDDIVFKGGGSRSDSDYQFALVNTGLAWDGTYSGNWRTKYFPTSQDTGTWIYVAVTHDTVTVKCYRNGTEISSQSDAGAIYESTYQLGISREGAANRGYLDGTLDEIRISNIARNESWLNTTYWTTYSPTSFYSIGIEESN